MIPFPFSTPVPSNAAPKRERNLPLLKSTRHAGSGSHPPSRRSLLALHIGGFRADPAAQGTDSSSSELSSKFLCRSGILLKHGGATEEDGYVDVADESAGRGGWLAGGKAWGNTMTVRRLRYEKPREETRTHQRTNRV